MILEKIIQLLKSPVFLVGLAVASSVVIYFVVTKSPPQLPTATLGPKCPVGFVVGTCLDGTTQCVKNCPSDRVWDCNSKKCVCQGTGKLCLNNTQCCNPCENDVCCSASNQITKNGVVSCCPVGTQPGKTSASSTVNDMCAVTCGDKVCNSNEECVKLSQLNQDTYINLLQNKKTEISSSDPSTNSITFCAPMTSCYFGDEQAFPPSIDNNYLYSNFEGNSTQNNFTVCLPTDKSSIDTACFANKTKDDCANANCAFLTLPDDYDSARDAQFTSYMNSLGQDNNLYYCDPGNGGLSLGRIVQYTSNGRCTWQDCMKQINSAGIVDSIWNESTQKCTAFHVPPYENIGSQPTQKIQCKDNGKGFQCKSCKKDTDFTTAIQCTGPGKPCGNCVSDEYICIDDGIQCDPITSGTGWVFNTCAPYYSVNNSVRVLGPGAGNCPWGCTTTDNSSSAPGGGKCYNIDIPTGSGNIFGDKSGSTGNVCLGDGRIVPEPVNPIYAYDTSGDSVSCHTVQTCPSNTICEISLCACIFKTVMPIGKKGFHIYSIINNEIKWITSQGENTCKPANSFAILNSDVSQADAFAINDGFHSGVGLWWYGTTGKDNRCGGAVPLLISPRYGSLCVNNENDCDQSVPGEVAYLWDSRVNAAVSSDSLMSNTAYNMSCDEWNVQRVGLNQYNNNLLVAGGSPILSFYAVPVSLFSVPTSCTTIPT